MIEQILGECTVTGNQIKLPPTQLDRDIYKQVADKLKKIGGKWQGGKVQAFVFPHDPTNLLAKIQGGEKVNLKKEFQRFETPEIVGVRVISLAEIEAHHTICEPEAGYGALIRLLPQNYRISCYEIDELCHPALANFPNVQLEGADFLTADESVKYDRIIANPPFSKNQDIDHLRKMWAVLANGGVMVSVASTHWQISNKKKESEFREWLDEVNAEIIPVEVGAFKESGTNVSTVIIRICKS